VERLAAAVHGGCGVTGGDGMPGIDELFGPPGDPAATLAEARRSLGLPAPPPQGPPPQVTDVAGLAERIGLA
jgi:hypothetical protein